MQGEGQDAGEVESRGHLPCLEWGKSVPGDPWTSKPHHPQPPQREPLSWVTSGFWIPVPGPWVLNSPHPHLEFPGSRPPSSSWGWYMRSGMGETGDRVTVASFGSFPTRGACRWAQVVTCPPLPSPSLGDPPLEGWSEPPQGFWDGYIHWFEPGVCPVGVVFWVCRITPKGVRRSGSRG